MAPGDHLRFITDRNLLSGKEFPFSLSSHFNTGSSIEDNEVMLPPTITPSTTISTSHPPWTGSYLLNSLYSLPLAVDIPYPLSLSHSLQSGTLVSLGVTNGVAGLGVIGGLVKSIVTTPFALNRQVTGTNETCLMVSRSHRLTPKPPRHCDQSWGTVTESQSVKKVRIPLGCPLCSLHTWLPCGLSIGRKIPTLRRLKARPPARLVHLQSSKISCHSRRESINWRMKWPR
jgi:hypothetical protein